MIKMFCPSSFLNEKKLKEKITDWIHAFYELFAILRTMDTIEFTSLD